MKLVQFRCLRLDRVALHNRIGLVTGVSPAAGEMIDSERLAKGSEDNAFFIEEAYNQEMGVVQHIYNLRNRFKERIE